MLRLVTPTKSESSCGCSIDWDEASRAASSLLRDAYRIDIYKALDPLNDDDFLAITQTIANELFGISGPPEASAVKAALQVLDVDWTTLTDSQRAEVVRSANLAMQGLPAQVTPKITSKLKLRLQDMMRSTKVSATKTLSLNISTSLNLVDKQMADSLSSIGSWITDEYGRRQGFFNTGVDRIVSDGLAQGLRSDDIAQDLKKLGDSLAVKQPANYWRLVALNSGNRARSYGHLSTMADGGITHYVFTAVLDERTSNICRALDETVFPVSTGLSKFSDLAIQSTGDFTAAEKVMPFVQQARLDGGEIEMFIEPPGMGRTVLGIASENGVGRADFKPKVRGLADPGQLLGAGVSIPPIHHACRSSIIADI